MSVRISKNIMGIRFSTNLLSDTSPKERRPTQAELAAEDKEQFLEKISDICNNGWLPFLEECGYTKQAILYALNNGGEVTDFLADEENQSIFLSLFDQKQELETLLNKVKFSNVLTAKKREEMTDVVFKIYDLINTAKRIYSDESVLKIIAERKNKPYDVVLKEKNKYKITRKKMSFFKKFLYWFFIITFLGAAVTGIVEVSEKEAIDGTEFFSILIFICIAWFLYIRYKKAKA
ncbi:hypothetical protein [Campylobacter concisus]|uniref:hypothetical protein n=1 Tax=Campylobacter concisus TaxID=199 RepID=UPI000D3200CE|nr:hypothetical protein [Campylobacter concisus]